MAKTKPKVSPLAPEAFPTIPPIGGVRVATRACGVRYKGRTDVLLVELADETQAAGVFTKSLTASAPVDWCRKSLPGGIANGLVVNSGNANAFTGRLGEDAVEQVVEAVADRLACRPSRVFAASTGVIGEPLNFTAITDNLDALAADLAPGKWDEAAKAIMTTDTFPKGAVKEAQINGTKVTIAGIAKGSGMIAPDMATMLAYVFTDAKIPAPVLQGILAPICGRTFNSITVDSDTSTSDSLMLFATGAAGNADRFSGPDDPALADFRAKAEAVMLDLAHQIVRDGEGASKFIEITVTGADSDAAAKRIGLSIANSPLVKTAIAGEDANWGRIVMAVGKAGEKAERDRLNIAIGGITIAANGLAVDGYDEAPVTAHMQSPEINIAVDVGVGNGRATVWTCDLTHGYIDINADYRS
ncbi:bifunctional glutamate N-acetyltransferase/amino-acid acetyltransferase ArgJ [Thalassospiraceae bacterium LMO-SO8]|nr:bifunctional glutamate N-acetyltransferase/amino-acid acetyltransferase ArgJ [Alphaproteobacteria bacterium LMO-S08]WND76180.1 bifunctional glutamate N-acetyltransferase/amino-acid acetyltransferase ArgJ [Thalassospiraceae bacterium LMO-SO8]